MYDLVLFCFFPSFFKLFFKKRTYCHNKLGNLKVCGENDYDKDCSCISGIVALAVGVGVVVVVLVVVEVVVVVAVEVDVIYTLDELYTIIPPRSTQQAFRNA